MGAAEALGIGATDADATGFGGSGVFGAGSLVQPK
jgi:hypothetical protein